MPADLPPDFKGTKHVADEHRPVTGVAERILRGLALVTVTALVSLFVTVVVYIVVGIWRIILTG